MKHYRIPVVLFILFTFGLSVRADPIKEQAAAWWKALGDRGLVHSLTVKEAAPAFKSIPSLPNKLFAFNNGTHYIGLGFTSKIKADDSLAAVRGKLQHVALDRLPTPGLKVEGWDIKPRTPVSSFKKGVTITGFAQGRIQLTVKTHFFALSGTKKNVLVPADAPMPPGTYFQIRENKNLDLTLDLPIVFE